MNGEDILFAMTSLGFENYAEALKIYLSKYREVSSSGSGSSSSPFSFRCYPGHESTPRSPSARAHLRAASVTNECRLNRQGGKTSNGQAVDMDPQARRQAQAAAALAAGLTHLHLQPPTMRRAKG